MQEWTIRHHVARVDFAGVDKSARCGKVASVDIAGVDNTAPCGRMDNRGVDLSAWLSRRIQKRYTSNTLFYLRF